MNVPFDREHLIAEARITIQDGDGMLARHDGSLARANYARASVLIQLAGYLGSAEEAGQRKAAIDAFTREAEAAVENLELQRGIPPQDIDRALAAERQRQDDYIAAGDLAHRATRDEAPA